jgi:hypothetical protein
MKRWSAGLFRVLFAFLMIFLAQIASISIGAIVHSHSGILSGLTFVVVFVCLFFFLERTFPSVYAELHRPKPWWQTRAAEAPVAIAFAFLVSILSSRIATLWFGLLAISAVLLALLLRMTARNRNSLTLLADVASNTGDHIRIPGYVHPQLPLKPKRLKQKDEAFRPIPKGAKPPFSIPDNYAIDARDLAALRYWYNEKLGLREVYDEREDDSGRPFVGLF